MKWFVLPGNPQSAFKIKTNLLQHIFLDASKFEQQLIHKQMWASKLKRGMVPVVFYISTCNDARFFSEIINKYTYFKTISCSVSVNSECGVPSKRLWSWRNNMRARFHLQGFKVAETILFIYKTLYCLSILMDKHLRLYPRVNLSYFMLYFVC